MNTRRKPYKYTIFNLYIISLGNIMHFRQHKFPNYPIIIDLPEHVSLKFFNDYLDRIFFLTHLRLLYYKNFMTRIKNALYQSNCTYTFQNSRSLKVFYKNNGFNLVLIHQYLTLKVRHMAINVRGSTIKHVFFSKQCSWGNNTSFQGI